MQIYNFPNIIPAATVLNTTVNSSPMQLMNMYGYSIQVVVTGTPTGSFKLQCSDDPVSRGAPNAPAVVAPSNWTTITNSSTTITAAGTIVWNASDVMYNWVRVVYTDTSSGSSTAIVASSTFNSKGV